MSATPETPAERVRELMERVAVAAGVDASVEISEQEDGLQPSTSARTWVC